MDVGARQGCICREGRGKRRHTEQDGVDRDESSTTRASRRTDLSRLMWSALVGRMFARTPAADRRTNGRWSRRLQSAEGDRDQLE